MDDKDHHNHNLSLVGCRCTHFSTTPCPPHLFSAFLNSVQHMLTKIRDQEPVRDHSLWKRLWLFGLLHFYRKLAEWRNKPVRVVHCKQTRSYEAVTFRVARSMSCLFKFLLCLVTTSIRHVKAKPSQTEILYNHLEERNPCAKAWIWSV